MDYIMEHIEYAYMAGGALLAYFAYTEIIAYLRGKKQRKKLADYERRTAAASK